MICVRFTVALLQQSEEHIWTILDEPLQTIEQIFRLSQSMESLFWFFRKKKKRVVRLTDRVKARQGCEAISFKALLMNLFHLSFIYFHSFYVM